MWILFGYNFATKDRFVPFLLLSVQPDKGILVFVNMLNWPGWESCPTWGVDWRRPRTVTAPRPPPRWAARHRVVSPHPAARWRAWPHSAALQSSPLHQIPHFFTLIVWSYRKQSITNGVTTQFFFQDARAKVSAHLFRWAIHWTSWHFPAFVLQVLYLLKKNLVSFSPRWESISRHKTREQKMLTISKCPWIHLLIPVSTTFATPPLLSSFLLLFSLKRQQIPANVNGVIALEQPV